MLSVDIFKMLIKIYCDTKSTQTSFHVVPASSYVEIKKKSMQFNTINAEKFQKVYSYF